MSKMTKGQVEAKISEEIICFEKEYMGRGPHETKAYIMKDIVFIRLKGVLTPAEEQLSKSAEGAELIKKVRIQLLENSKKVLEKIILEITGCQVKSLHTDISTRTGERIIVFTLNKDYESNFIRNAK